MSVLMDRVGLGLGWIGGPRWWVMAKAAQRGKLDEVKSARLNSRRGVPVFTCSRAFHAFHSLLSAGALTGRR